VASVSTSDACLASRRLVNQPIIGVLAWIMDGSQGWYGRARRDHLTQLQSRSGGDGILQEGLRDDRWRAPGGLLPPLNPRCMCATLPPASCAQRLATANAGLYLGRLPPRRKAPRAIASARAPGYLHDDVGGSRTSEVSVTNLWADQNMKLTPTLRWSAFWLPIPNRNSLKMVVPWPTTPALSAV
jgi:hypothetical protein